MEYLTALDAIIRKGIEAAKRDYAQSPHKSEGAIAGFEACRGKTPLELLTLLQEENKKQQDYYWKSSQKEISIEDYWKQTCLAREIEWTCNCVSVILSTMGIPSPFPAHVGPTASAYMNVATIIGVRAPD